MTIADQQKMLSNSKDMSDPLLSSPSQLQNAGCESAKSLSSSSAEHCHKVPVFQSEDDRLMFDRCLEVDIAPLVSGMYRLQAVEQNAADCSNITTRSTVNLFTCMTCSKVFTSLSHCQLHCLIHTTARPFQCPWCNYSTNIRGYLADLCKVFVQCIELFGVGPPFRGVAIPKGRHFQPFPAVTTYC